MSKHLWGGEKPIELEELTMNINTDDTYERIKKTVWNNKKKTFQTQMIDGLGNRVKNESGQMIKKSDKFHPYKDWKRKSKLTIQNVGEIENQAHIRNVKERILERKDNKKSKSTLKSFEEILKGKKKKLKKKKKRKKKKQFSKKKYKENLIKQRVHLNSKSQTFIKTRRSGKGSKHKSKGKRK